MLSEATRQRLKSALPGLARLAVFGLALGALALFVRIHFGEALRPKVALALLQRWQGETWAIPTFGLIYLVLTTALAPAVLFHMVAGAAWGFRVGLWINLVAFNGSATAHFWLARWMGRERVTALLRALGLARWAERVQGVGLRSAIALRVLPFPTLVASAMAGVSGMRWRDFALGTLVGAVPWITIYTYFAAQIVAGVEGAERKSLVQGFAASVIILSATLGPRVWRRVRASRRGNIP